MPGITDWRTSEPGDVLAGVVDHWNAGRVVALPTESTWEAAVCALAPGAVELLRILAPEEAPALVLGTWGEARDWLPGLRGVGLRLLRKYAPGPLVLEADGGAAYGLLSRLPDAVSSHVVLEGRARLRCPDHPAWPAALRLLRAPLLTVPLAATSVEQAAEQLGDRAALVVGDGPTFFAQQPTRVRVTGKEWEVLHEGGLVRAEVAAGALCRIVFICTGNTCRSPLAEVLCAKLLAEALDCTPADLPRHGFLVQSAGLAAMMGGTAAVEAIEVARTFGADLTGHRSQPLTYELFTQADIVFAMTASHLYALQGAGVESAPPVCLLAPNGTDIADPVGCEREVYEACARDLLTHLRARLPELLETR